MRILARFSVRRNSFWNFIASRTAVSWSWSAELDFELRILALGFEICQISEIELVESTFRVILAAPNSKDQEIWPNFAVFSLFGADFGEIIGLIGLVE